MERSTGAISVEHYIICLAAAIQSFLSDTILHVWSNCLLISELFLQDKASNSCQKVLISVVLFSCLKE